MQPVPARLMGKHRGGIKTDPIPLVAPRPGQPPVAPKPVSTPTEPIGDLPFWQLADTQEDPLRPPVWLWILLLVIGVGLALVVGWIWGNAAGMASAKDEASTVSVYTPAPETVTVTPKAKPKKGTDKTVRITAPGTVRTVTLPASPGPTKTVTAPAPPRPTKAENLCFEIGPAGELLDLPCPAPGG